MKHNGNIYTGRGEIVGPEEQALKLRDGLNDPELHVAWTEGSAAAGGATLYTRAMMEQVAIRFPVLAVPLEVKEQWEAEPGPAQHLPVYEGPLPTRGRRTSFGLVKPGDRQ